jgi:septal ring factor EnvC (AmiA/AmiB activator)
VRRFARAFHLCRAQKKLALKGILPMQRLEPAFDHISNQCPPELKLLRPDTEALEKKITEQSSELNERLTEVLELYNVQSRLTNELQAAYDKIARLEQTIAELISQNNELSGHERDRAVLSQQLTSILLEMEIQTQQLISLQAALNTEKANTASAHTQLEQLKSEMATATAERFKLVAMIYEKKRRAI